MKQTAEKTARSIMNFNKGADSGALEIRLNSDPIKRRVEIYLRGLKEQEVQDPKTEKWTTTYVKIGKPKVNMTGLQKIMSFVETRVNSQTVQGNLERQEYKHYLQKTHMSLATDLFVNMAKYGIDADEYNGIVEDIMGFIELFLSRTIDNKERDSYNDFMRVHETDKTKQSRSSGGISFGL